MFVEICSLMAVSNNINTVRFIALN